MRRPVPIACSTCWVRARAEWSVLDRSEVALLNRAHRPRVYMPGETIFHQDDEPQGLYCVESGHILLRQLDAFGNEIAFQLVVPGDTMGWRSFFAEQPHAATARALTACRVCLIPSAPVRQLLERNPALGLRFLRTLARDRGPSEAPLLRSPHLPVRMRLVHLLLVLKDSCAASSTDGELVLELPLSRSDIAAMVGARAETVTRTIRDLQDEGVVRFCGRQVIVPELDRLLDIVGKDATGFSTR